LLQYSTGGPHDGDHDKGLGLPGVMGDPAPAAGEALRIRVCRDEEQVPQWLDRHPAFQ
jgi:hypothetical protein